MKETSTVPHLAAAEDVEGVEVEDEDNNEGEDGGEHDPTVETIPIVKARERTPVSMILLWRPYPW